MTKTILITESQYRRLFLLEQWNLPSGGAEMYPSYQAMKPLEEPFNNAMSTLQSIPDDFANFIYEYRHEIIDVLAVAALFIPIPGLNVAISMALEGVNAAMYFAENDEISGFIAIICMALPAVGPLIRRMGSKGAKKVYNIYKTSKSMKNNGKSATQISEYISKESKKLSPPEVDLIKKLSQKDVDKLLQKSADELRVLSKDNIKIKAKHILDNAFGKGNKEWNRVKNYYSGWGEGSKFLTELLNPSLLEKYIIAGTVVSLIVIDKTGVARIATEEVVSLLQKIGLIDGNLTDQEIDTVKEGLAKSVDLSKYDLDSVNVEIRDGNNILTLPEKDQEKILSSIESRVKVYVDTLNWIPPSKDRYKVLELPLEKQKELVNEVSDGKYLKPFQHQNLRNFRVYKWAELCSKKTNKDNITVDVVDDEKADWLSDRILNNRYIKSPKLGSKYEYAADDIGFWYYKLLDSNSTWKPVTNCGALLKIETLLEKQDDPDIDTEEEIDDILNNYLKY